MLLMAGALLIMSHVQAAVLYDEGASSSTSFMIFQGIEKEKGRY